MHENLLDAADFEFFFKEWFTPLCAFCQLKFDFELETAKDVVHSGFIKLWENRNNITPGLSIKSYLYKIVNNLCLDIIRHEKVKQKHSAFISYTSTIIKYDEPIDQYDVKKLIFDIDKAVSELPEQMRKIFELSRYEGLKYADISLRLNISITTVETQMSRALVKLREKLAQYLIIIAPLFLLSL